VFNPEVAACLDCMYYPWLVGLNLPVLCSTFASMSSCRLSSLHRLAAVKPDLCHEQMCTKQHISVFAIAYCLLHVRKCVKKGLNERMINIVSFRLHASVGGLEDFHVSRSGQNLDGAAQQPGPTQPSCYAILARSNLVT